MKYDWILDVLTDLRKFAQVNGLPRLAEQLDDTRLLAAAEMTQSACAAPKRARNDAKTARAAHRRSAANNNA